MAAAKCTSCKVAFGDDEKPVRVGVVFYGAPLPPRTDGEGKPVPPEDADYSGELLLHAACSADLRATFAALGVKPPTPGA